MTIPTAQDVADQLAARIRVKRESLASTPDIESLKTHRVALEGQIDGLTQALAMVRRLPEVDH